MASTRSDPRVTVVTDDARHFLRTTTKKYDLVVFALIDSLTLQSGFASVRLESYMFTKESFEAVRDRLSPRGVMVQQRGMVNHLFAKVKDLRLGDGDSIVQNASQCFDISVWQFFAALVVGGRVEAHVVALQAVDLGEVGLEGREARDRRAGLGRRHHVDRRRLRVPGDLEARDGVAQFVREGSRSECEQRAQSVRRRPLGVARVEKKPGDTAAVLAFELGDPGSISTSFLAKVPGPALQLGEAHMDFSYADAFGGTLETRGRGSGTDRAGAAGRRPRTTRPR